MPIAVSPLLTAGQAIPYTLVNSINSGLATWQWSVNASGNNLSNLGVVSFTNGGYVNGRLGINAAPPPNAQFYLSNSGDTNIALQGAGGSLYWITAQSAVNGTRLMLGGNGLTPPSTGVININNVGNVGIGTTSPNAPLHISSSTDELLRLNSGSANGPYIRFLYSGVNKWTIGHSLGQAAANSFVFRDEVAGVNALTVLSGGNVGIGTTSPSANLEVWGASPGIKIINNPGVAGDPYLTISAAGAVNTATINLGTAVLRNDTNKLTGTLLINPDGGNVGIGTTSAPARLSVSCTGLFAGDPSLNTDTAVVLIGNQTATQLGIGGYTGNGVVWLQTKYGGNDGRAFPIVLNPLGGNIGIGTASPATKLDVSGIITWPGGNLSYDGNGCGYVSSNSGKALLLAPGGATKMSLLTAGDVIQSVRGGPAGDTDLWNSSMCIWFDEGNNRLAFKTKTSGGVIKTGYLAVA